MNKTTNNCQCSEYKATYMGYLLILLDNLIQSEQCTHPCGLAVLSQEGSHFVHHSRPLVREIMPQDLTHTYCQLKPGSKSSDRGISILLSNMSLFAQGMKSGAHVLYSSLYYNIKPAKGFKVGRAFQLYVILGERKRLQRGEEGAFLLPFLPPYCFAQHLIFMSGKHEKSYSLVFRLT